MTEEIEHTVITEEFLRKRAEHNEGLLSTLEEITLHQQNIMKIENIDKFCRHLKILYLQNNLIPKIENVHKLKELEYLNLAVNNVRKIEGISTCESLYKLDMTLNFIELDALKESIEHLALCPSIKELTLTGNPCTDWKDYKDYVIAKIPQLCRIDSTDITKSMKIVAEQRLEELELDLAEQSEIVRIKRENTPVNLNAYNPETRLKDYYDEIERKKEEARNKPKNPFELPDEFKHKKTGPPSVYNEQGEIRQWNEGRYEFLITEDTDNDRILVELYLPKFLNTELIDADINPLYVRIAVKGKITQLKLPEEIEVDKSKIERSTTTGSLLITCPTVNKRLRNTAEYKQQREEYRKKKLLQELESKMNTGQFQTEEYKDEAEEENQGKENLDSNNPSKKQDVNVNRKDEPYEPDFDLDELPDLE